MKTILLVSFVSVFFTTTALAADSIATLRGDVPVSDSLAKTERITKAIADDVKVSRNYPMQPPLIPHNVRDYQIDLRVNKCLSCHSRKRTSESQATMISVTHYMDRDGNFLADISPRRYFCNQCHVVQHNSKPLVDNDFVDMDELISGKAAPSN